MLNWPIFLMLTASRESTVICVWRVFLETLQGPIVVQPCKFLSAPRKSVLKSLINFEPALNASQIKVLQSLFDPMCILGSLGTADLPRDSPIHDPLVAASSGFSSGDVNVLLSFYQSERHRSRVALNFSRQSNLASSLKKICT